MSIRRKFRRPGFACIALLLAAGAHAQGVADPMRPAGAAPVSARPRAVFTLKLEGVIAGAERVAIINGRLVRAGDEIGGAKILEINNDGVRYARAGKVQSLLLPNVRALGSVRVASAPEAHKPGENKPEENKP